MAVSTTLRNTTYFHQVTPRILSTSHSSSRIHSVSIPPHSTTTSQPLRFYSSSNGDDDDNNNNNSPPSDHDDDFDSFEFEDLDETEVIVKETQDLSKDAITPLMASEIVDKLVESTTKKYSTGSAFTNFDFSKVRITTNLLYVLSALRVGTYTVYAHTNTLSRNPEEKKVVGYLSLKELGLSMLAQEALKKIAGVRYKVERDEVIVVYNKYGSLLENKLQVLYLMERLVRYAKEAVGEKVEVEEAKEMERMVEVVEQMGVAQRMDEWKSYCVKEMQALEDEEVETIANNTFAERIKESSQDNEQQQQPAFIKNDADSAAN